VISERICGLARVIRGHLVTALENTNLWHERDISHSSAERVIFPDATELLGFLLVESTRLVDGLLLDKERMAHNLNLGGGLVFSQRALLALIEKGMARDQAYRVVQAAALRSWDEGLDFREQLQGDAAITNLLNPEELDAIFDHRWHLKHLDLTFSRVGIGEEK